MVTFKPGQIIRFTYNHLRTDADSGDRHKEVLVLNPKWMGKVHAIDMKRLTAAEREVLQAIFDEKWKGKRHRMPLVNDVLRRMNPHEEAKNPLSFYHKFVRIFLKNKDAYRQYMPPRMVNVTVVKVSTVVGGVYNPKPLFHKADTDAGKQAATSAAKEKEIDPAEKQKRLAAIQKAAVKLFGKKGQQLAAQPTRASAPTPAKKPTPSTPSQPAQGSRNMADRLAMLKAYKKGK